VRVENVDVNNQAARIFDSHGKLHNGSVVSHGMKVPTISFMNLFGDA
jgi:hypothetical protein